MNFKLMSIYHPFKAAPHRLRVDLAMTLGIGDEDMDEGTMTVWIEPQDIKKATMDEIEELAIARARQITGS
ncbi:hypothetical protein JAO10_32940 [Burkholderia contaminans]|uniref:hypothetical protein n=1 Tax=Burkholderia cepacia complex TaxID=87882 RepID=UPI0018DD59C2|nr:MULTISPECIES: hypothetical protein [Burkholderia cepacia complex]MBH9725139.1 hypothetical protein [Burkholderia contaminans]MDN7413037.1 hypothetical protein [Burkholderia vietnamiensis]